MLKMIYVQLQGKLRSFKYHQQKATITCDLVYRVHMPQVAVVHLNFRTGSTFPGPV